MTESCSVKTSLYPQLSNATDLLLKPYDDRREVCMKLERPDVDFQPSSRSR